MSNKITKISKLQLRRIIREEVQRSLMSEGAADPKMVKLFIDDYGKNASSIQKASSDEIRGWFEGNGYPAPKSTSDFRDAVMAELGI